MRLAALVILLTACGAGGNESLVHVTEATSVLARAETASMSETAPNETAAPEPEPCGMVFSPATELLDATTRAAARWSAATGCDVRVGAGGIPVVILPEVILSNGEARRSRAVVGSSNDRIEYRRRNLADAGEIMPHELGHMLGGYGHSDSGVMKGLPETPIDAASLLLVCENLHCESFSPEAAL